VARTLNDDSTDDPKPKAGKGHNSNPPKVDLSKEDHAALLNHHIGRLRAQQSKVELARAPFDAERQALTDLINAAKSDLGKGYTRKRLSALLEDFGARVRNLMQEEEQRAQDRIALGLPVYGLQADLFGSTAPQEQRDEFTFEADGYGAGRRGDEPTPPADVPERFVQLWMKGYHKGQEENGLQLGRVDAIIARQAPTKAEPAAPEDAEAAADKTVRKLRKSGFMDTSAPASTETLQAAE